MFGILNVKLFFLWVSLCYFLVSIKNSCEIVSVNIV